MGNTVKHSRPDSLGVSLVFMFVLVACSTPYKPNGLMGGYSETPIQADQYLVNFRGNGYTSTEKAYRFALYRCAELTVQAGYDYFVVFDEKGEKKDAYVITQSRYIETISKPRVTLNIKMFKGKKPDDDAAAIDARELMRVMGPPKIP
jgi:hypothetical protein